MNSFKQTRPSKTERSNHHRALPGLTPPTARQAGPRGSCSPEPDGGGSRYSLSRVPRSCSLFARARRIRWWGRAPTLGPDCGAVLLQLQRGERPTHQSSPQQGRGVRGLAIIPTHCVCRCSSAAQRSARATTVNLLISPPRRRRFFAVFLGLGGSRSKLGGVVSSDRRQSRCPRRCRPWCTFLLRFARCQSVSPGVAVAPPHDLPIGTPGRAQRRYRSLLLSVSVSFQSRAFRSVPFCGGCVGSRK
jgi:hypothetical protein